MTAPEQPKAPTESVLHRKLRAARAEAQALANEGGPGADRSWRLSLARAAQDVLSMPLDVPRQSMHRRSLTEVMDVLPDYAMLAVLEGPGDALGLLALAPPVLSGLIEVQTMGRVLGQAPLPRKPTRTDAAMVAPVIERALAALDEALADEADLVWAGGFRYASFLDDPRPLQLLLEDQPYKVLTAQVSLSGGAKTGEVILALPAEGRGRRPHVAAVLAQDAQEAQSFTQALGDVVLGVGCQLDAVLTRLVLPLGEVLALEPGAVLAVPKSALASVRIEGMGGAVLTGARLGQNSGLRAVRLLAPAVEPVLAVPAQSVQIPDEGPILATG